jgi:hypothetical protein
MEVLHGSSGFAPRAAAPPSRVSWT